MSLGTSLGTEERTAGDCPSAGLGFFYPGTACWADLPFFFSTPPTKPVCPAVLLGSQETSRALSTERPISSSCRSLCRGSCWCGQELAHRPAGCPSHPKPLPSCCCSCRDEGWRSQRMQGWGLIELGAVGSGAAGQRLPVPGKSNCKPSKLRLFIHECRGRAGN